MREQENTSRYLFSPRLFYSKQIICMVDNIIALVTICSWLAKIMKESALQKTDQNVVGRFVIMKMSGESGHLLRSPSFMVYKTLQTKKNKWSWFLCRNNINSEKI